MSEELRVEDHGPVRRLIVNRPQRMNAWTPRIERALHEAVIQAQADPGVRVILLTGAGRAFCAGADLEAMDSGAYHAEQARQRQADAQSRFGYLRTCDKPVVAALNGAAVAVGLVVALHCDIRIARAGAKLAFAFPRLGLAAEQGTSWLLGRLVGEGRARDLLLTGRTFTADEALGFGLVTHLLEAEAFDESALQWARTLAEEVSPHAMKRIKRQLANAPAQSYEQAVAADDLDIAACRQHADLAEGIDAVRNKRKPDFKPLSPGA